MLAEDLNSLARCVELLGIGCLTEQSMPELVQIIVSTMNQHFERQQERNQKRKDEDYDEGVEDQVLYKQSYRNTLTKRSNLSIDHWQINIFPISAG